MKSLRFLFVLLLSGTIWAQTTTQGAILGQVTDSSGGVVRSAKVMARNIATGISAVTRSDAQGNYRFSLLQPSVYALTISAQGYSTIKITGVTVGVGQTNRTDVHMKIGSVTQEITVSSTSAQIDTESGTLGDVIGSNLIENLPLNGREFLQLSALEPGAVSNNPKRGVQSSKGVDVSFNGARDGYNGYYIDGATNTDPLYNQMQSSPSLDSIGEFQILTNNYSAQYGNAGGAIVSVVTKSGTNAFHGTAYEYLRNKVLDALPYFYVGPRDQAPNYLFNQYGGTIGGPIIKDKTFFFFSVEFFHEVQPGQEFVSLAPTTAERNGDFSQTINPYSGQPVQLMNPYTGQPIPSEQLPASLMNPVGQKLMSLWPQPNYPADSFLNLRFFRSSPYTQKKYLGRIDHHFSANDSISGTFDFDNYDRGVTGYNVYGDKLQADHNKTGAGTWTHIFAPHLVNDLKGSFSAYLSGSQFALADKNYCASWGFASSINTVQGTCRIYFYGLNYQSYNIGNDGNFVHHDNTVYLTDNLMWSKGRHTVTFGGSFTRQMFRWQYDSGTSQYFFGSDDGNPSLQQYYGVAGSTFADVLMGLPNFIRVGLGGTGGPSDMHLLRNMYSIYAQDDWKVSSRLTLNLGVRYDYQQPFANTDNELMTLDFNTGLPVYSKGAPQDQLNLVQFKYETGGPNRPYQANTLNVAPRFGFAWSPFADSRTVLKGGYGLFYISDNAFDTIYSGWVPPFQGVVRSYPADETFWPDGQKHLVPVDQVPYGLDYLRGADPGSFTPNPPYYPTSYTEQYNLSVERDLGGKWGAQIGYVGSRGVNLGGPQAVSTYDPALSAKLTANGFGDFGLNTKGFSSGYNALQARLKKQTAHGLNMIVSYTYSHALANASNDAALENLVSDVNAYGNVVKKEWSNADFDVRHRLTAGGTYELPFGPGKNWGRDWNKFTNGALGGWRLSFIYTLQSGFPFTVYSSETGYLPDQVCGGNLSSGNRSTNHWFDYNCFPDHTPTLYTDPTTGVQSLINLNGDARPNAVRGPNTDDFDLGLEKNFTFMERHHIEFRAEEFNLLNHPNLIGPSGNYFYNTMSGSEITRANSARDIQVAIRYSF